MTAQTFSTSIQAAARPLANQGALAAARIWSGRAMTGLAALFFLMDGTMKLFKPAVVVETTVQLGYPEATITGIGIVLLVSTLLYLLPRTAALGAVLLTGYLGGAVATHVRVGATWFPILFPVLLAMVAWGGLWLRNAKVRGLVPTIENAGGVSSRRLVLAGRVLSGLPVLWFLMSGIMSLFKTAAVVEGTLQLGYPESSIVGMGIALLASTIVYLIPRTAALGAVLLTGYLGGAVATHVRIGDTWSHILLPALFGAIVWGGLWLRHASVRRMLPLAEPSQQ